MTLTTILTDCYSRLRYSAAPAAAILARLTRHANEAHRELLAMPGMMRLREDTLAITAAANQPRTSLPQAVGRIRAIVDRTNNRKLESVSLTDLRVSDPGRTLATGTIERYAEVGWRPIQLQPSDASELFIKSTSASDGVATTAYLEGIRSDGSIVSLSITMNGLTAKSFGATETAIVEVTKFYLSAAAVGTVTLIEDSGAGTVLATIGIGQTYARYLTVEWQPYPTTNTVLYVDHVRNVTDLANGTDEPLLPLDFHYLIPLRVRMKEYEVTDDATRFAECRGEWEAGKSALRSWVLNSGDQVASLRPTDIGFSQLGAMFPSGS